MHDDVASPSNGCKWWSFLWKLHIPPKIKNFIWRSCLNALPSTDNLWKRKIVTEPCCCRCKVKPESAVHALFQCKALKKIWVGTRFGNLISSRIFRLVQEVFQFFLPQLEPSVFCQFCVVVWAIWTDRNNMVNGGSFCDPSIVVSRAISMLDEFTNSKQAMAVSPPSSSRRSDVEWIVPPSGQLKLNSTVRFRNKSDKIGLGSAIRDYKGRVIATSTNTLRGNFSLELGHFGGARWLKACPPVQPLSFDFRSLLYCCRIPPL